MKITLRKIPFAVVLLILLLGACKKAPEIKLTTTLPRSIPEAEGVSSEGIMAFLEAAADSRNEFHSFMFLRHGKVIAEGWWNPYRPDLKHTLYSTSKSFTSTAVGFAVSENLLTVNDKVISFFPEDLPDTVSPYLADLTVKDLLMMSAGQDPDPTSRIVQSDSNWVKVFLSTPIVNDPGTKFLYNSMATYMLSAIVQKVTGEKVIDFLMPRLFEPLAIEGIDWEVDPDGINTGGWGLRVKTEDMAKFGQLYLQQGMWNGKQVLPAAWVEEATSYKIDNSPGAPQSVRDSSEWAQGYCYQFWRCRHNAFRADGAYGQYIIVLPDQDAVIAIQAETPDMQDEINLVWKYLFPAIRDVNPTENSAMTGSLHEKLKTLALPLPAKGEDSPVISEISGKTFILKPNDTGIESLNISFEEDKCRVTLKERGKDYEMNFGAERWIEGITARPGPNLLKRAKAHNAGLPPEKIAGSYSWKDDNTLELILRYIESPHTEKIICKFDRNKISVEYQPSMAFGETQPLIAGEVEK
jgi:CubicO group peptidase (beta-lactamase class C family)